MELTILGSGTSTGVPEIGCKCSVCTSLDSRDRRLRTSALVRTSDAVILIDCGPDFRTQVMQSSFYEKIDGVLITHEHYDHVGGLDDLRPFCRFAEIPVFASKPTAMHLRMRMPYCFVEKIYPGVPQLVLKEIESNIPFYINHTEILPLRVLHGKLPILGYRINNSLGYITDMSIMPKETFEALSHLDVLIINALRVLPHPTHQCISEALDVVERIGAKETYLIHMSHQAGLYNEISKELPPHVHYAFDGLNIQF